MVHYVHQNFVEKIAFFMPNCFGFCLLEIMVNVINYPVISYPLICTQTKSTMNIRKVKFVKSFILKYELFHLILNFSTTEQIILVEFLFLVKYHIY